MKKKLLLINPVTPGKAQFQTDRYSTYQPLGLGIIAALTPEHWEVEILDENFEVFSYRRADLVGITAYTPSANRAYQVAGVFRSRGIPTIMGGIHASILPDEALEFVDSVVIGEAESVWKKVIVDFEAGTLQNFYHGELLPLEGVPLPRRELFDKRYILASVQTTRGCPMHCDFCSVTVFNGRNYRRRPVEEILEELQLIPQKKLFFVDDNLIGSGKEEEERAILLFKGMIEKKLNKRWFCQTSLNVTRNEEVLYYAARSGCRMMLIGVESEKEAALEDLGKKVNLNILKRYNEVFKLINKHGIAILGGFIFGTDADSIENLRSRAQYIKDSRIDVMQPTILTPYPGTRTYEKYRESGRLLYTGYPADWEKYDMTEILFEPSRMATEEFRKAMIDCYSALVNRWVLFIKFIKTLIFTKSPVTALWAVNTNRVYRKILIQKIKEWKKDV